MNSGTEPVCLHRDQAHLFSEGAYNTSPGTNIDS